MGNKTKTWHVIPAVVATAIMSFCGVLIETAMNVTFPTLMTEFNTDSSGIQWVTTGYLLAIAIVVPITAYLTRNYTIRQLFLAANLLFIGGVLIDCISPNLMILLLGRFMQGIGTGIALPLMFHIVLSKVPLHQHGTVIGIGAMTTALAPPIGPTFGGVVSSAFGWRAIFFALIPFLAFSLVMGLWAIPTEESPKKQPFNFMAFVTLGIGLASLLMAIEHLSVLYLGVVVVAFAAFFYFNRENALLSFKPFQFATFNATLYIVLAFQGIVLGLSFIYPNYIQLAWGETATVAGLFMFPGAAMVAILSALSGRWYDKSGPLKPILTGLIFAVIGGVSISFFFPGLTIYPLLALNVIFMTGIGFVMGSNVTYSLAQLKPEIQADGNSIVNTLQQFTGAISTTIIARIFSSFDSNLVTAGRTSILFVTTLAVIALVVFLWIYPQTQKKN